METHMGSSEAKSTLWSIQRLERVARNVRR